MVTIIVVFNPAVVLWEASALKGSGKPLAHACPLTCRDEKLTLVARLCKGTLTIHSEEAM